MLSNVSIKKYLSSGDIAIDPWDDAMLGPARVVLHLGQRILVPRKSGVVDIRKNITPEYEELVLDEARPFLLDPGMFVIGETLETIGLSERIGMLIDGRSTISRLGVSVTQTSMIIDTGQKPKNMTLEIYNAGPNSVLLYPNMKFCRACFFLIDPPASIRYDTKGKYQSGDVHRPQFTSEFKE